MKSLPLFWFQLHLGECIFNVSNITYPMNTFYATCISHTPIHYTNITLNFSLHSWYIALGIVVNHSEVETCYLTGSFVKLTSPTNTSIFLYYMHRLIEGNFVDVNRKFVKIRMKDKNIQNCFSLYFSRIRTHNLIYTLYYSELKQQKRKINA